MELKFTNVRRGRWCLGETGVYVERGVPYINRWTVWHEGAAVGDRGGYELFPQAAEAAREFWSAKQQAEAHDAPVTPAEHADSLAARIAEVLAEHAAAPQRPLDAIASATAPEADLGDLLYADELLLRRIVARAKYDALREMLRTLNGWVEGARSNLEAMGRLAADVERDSRTFDVDDIRMMVNDAARACGTSEPYVKDAS